MYVFILLLFLLQTRVMGQDPGFLCGLEQGGDPCYRACHSDPTPCLQPFFRLLNLLAKLGLSDNEIKALASRRWPASCSWWSWMCPNGVELGQAWGGI